MTEDPDDTTQRPHVAQHLNFYVSDSSDEGGQIYPEHWAIAALVAVTIVIAVHAFLEAAK